MTRIIWIVGVISFTDGCRKCSNQHKKEQEMKRFFSTILAFFVQLFGRKPAPNIAEQNRAEHIKRKSVWDNSRQSAQLKTMQLIECFTDSLGNVYYFPAQSLSITVERELEIIKASLAAYRGIDDDYLDSFEQLITKAQSQKNTALISAYLQDFFYRRKHLPQREKLLHLACLYLYRWDENPYIYDPIIQNDKLKTALSDPALYGFFLRFAYQIYITDAKDNPALQDGWTLQSEPDFLRYSAGEKPMRSDKVSTPTD
jgi:hypothetical protein